MENNSQALTNGDKPTKERDSRNVALCAAILACIALVFFFINLRGRLSDVMANGRVGAVMLELEVGLSPETKTSETEELSSPPSKDQTSLPKDIQPATDSPVTQTTPSELFPPAAANSHATAPALPSAEPNASESVITTVIKPKSDDGYLVFEDIYIQNNTRYSPDVEELLNAPWEFDGSPTVLIIHTHATECYTPTELDDYSADSGDRTESTDYNVVRVGEELAAELRKQGIRVIHDETLFDSESYTGAYARSNAAVKEWLKKDPSIAVVLDLHRDALNKEGSTKYRIAVESEYGDAAQMLILVGTDASGANHPDWQDNLSLALKLQRNLNELCPNVTRPMLLTNGSYDQETTQGSLLIEMGANGNSLSDALVSAKLLGRALGEILG